MPMTRAEMQAIRERRSELSSQLISASGRREELAAQLRTTGQGPDRAGLEQRIGVLDERIVRLESDIAATGRLLTNAPAGLLVASSGEQVFGVFGPGQTLAMGIVVTIFVLAPLAIGAARMMWKRAGAPVRNVIPPETAGRLERIEQAVEAIAVEVERVSEGQRFVTKLMSENNKAVAAFENTRMLPQTHSGSER